VFGGAAKKQVAKKSRLNLLYLLNIENFRVTVDENLLVAFIVWCVFVCKTG